MVEILNIFGFSTHFNTKHLKLVAVLPMLILIFTSIKIVLFNFWFIKHTRLCIKFKISLDDLEELDKLSSEKY